MSIVGKILNEASYDFLDSIPARFSFIMRDTTKFPEPDMKWKAVNALEKAIKSKKVPIKEIPSNMLIMTQRDPGDPFVVKFHQSYYLVRGLVDLNQKFVKCPVYELDDLAIGLVRQTSYSR